MRLGGSSFSGAGGGCRGDFEKGEACMGFQSIHTYGQGEEDACNMIGYSSAHIEPVDRTLPCIMSCAFQLCSVARNLGSCAACGWRLTYLCSSNEPTESIQNSLSRQFDAYVALWFIVRKGSTSYTKDDIEPGGTLRLCASDRLEAWAFT